MIPFDSTGARNHDIPFSRVEYDDHYTAEAFRWLSVLKWDFILWKIMVSHNDLNLTNIIDGQQIKQTKNHYSPQHASIRKKNIFATFVFAVDFLLVGLGLCSRKCPKICPKI